jgi:hypothetical protein
MICKERPLKELPSRADPEKDLDEFKPDHARRVPPGAAGTAVCEEPVPHIS